VTSERGPVETGRTSVKKLLPPQVIRGIWLGMRGLVRSYVTLAIPLMITHHMTCSGAWRAQMHVNFHHVCACFPIILEDGYFCLNLSIAAFGIRIHEKQVGRTFSIGVGTGYELNSCSSFPSRCKRFFSSPQRQDRLCCSPSLHTMSTRGSLSWCKAAGAWSWPLNST
jgi:hypothetical protein